MAKCSRLISALALMSIFMVTQYIPTVRAVVQEEIDVIITTGKNYKGSISGATLAIQSEVAGTVLTLVDKDIATVEANKASTFRTSSLGISGDICFVQLQYTGGSALEWPVGTIKITTRESKNLKTVTFEVNKSVKITEALTVDTCKQRQKS